MEAFAKPTGQERHSANSLVGFPISCLHIFMLCGESKSGQLWRAKAEFRRIIRPMKHQIANRLGVAHVRDTIIQLVAGSITREQAIGAEIEVL